MIGLLVWAATLGGLFYLHSATRGYVRRRLRYVDAVQKPTAPLIAGAVTTLVAWPIAAVLPFVGAGTAIAAGVTVALGVLQGARETRGVLPP